MNEALELLEDIIESARSVALSDLPTCDRGEVLAIHLKSGEQLYRVMRVIGELKSLA